MAQKQKVLLSHGGGPAGVLALVVVDLQPAVGTINGMEGYNFMLTAIDGALIGSGRPDRFRMKIWDTISGVVVYDNQPATDDTSELGNSTVLGGGSVVIHKGN